MDLKKFKNDIFLIREDSEFNNLALKLFKYQSKKNKSYKKYIELLNINPETINSVEQIPFLPIDIFRKNKILCENIKYEKIFLSSGTTTTTTRSRHYIESIQFYEKSIKKSFEKAFGQINDYTIFCITPNHQQENTSSLIHMCEYLIHNSNCPNSGFYYNDHNNLIKKIKTTQKKKKKFILIGLSFGILDFANKKEIDLNDGIVIETGGMKSVKKEISKDELYANLKERLKIEKIGSEYSMTELLSQSYSSTKGQFIPPPWKKILIREQNNPLKLTTKEMTTGGINIIDLANTHSCAFIATNDLGKKEKNYFYVLGRYDNSSIRGCNNML